MHVFFSQVGGAVVALHISRSTSAEEISKLPRFSLPQDRTDGDSYINRLLHLLRSQTNQQTSAAVQAAMAAAFHRSMGVENSRDDDLSSSLSDGGSAGSGGRAPAPSKRQAMGDPSTSSPLKRQDLDCSTDDEDFLTRPSYSSSAASALPRPPAATVLGRLNQQGFRGAKPSISQGGDGGDNIDTAEGHPGRRPWREFSAGNNHAGNGSRQRSTSPFSASAGEGPGALGEASGTTTTTTTTSARSNCALSDALLEHFPETRLALESYRGSKQGAQVRGA